jgi:C4-dicarboxylate-specific signal transduction histidine kinase
VSDSVLQTNTRTAVPQFEPTSVQSGEVLSNLIHKIGHEIGNPLTAIISLATIIERFGDETPGQDFAPMLKRLAGYSTSIIEEAWKISAQSERLVMLLSQKPGNCSACGLAEAVKKTAQKLRSRGRVKKLDLLVSEIGERPAQWFMDAEQLHLLLQELFLNASAGLSYAGFSDVAGSNANIHVLIKGGTEESYLAVSNEFDAPAPEDLACLFEPFVSNWSEKKHLGLGLTVCWSIVRRFNGRIQIIEEKQSDRWRFTVAIHLPARGNTGADLAGDSE